VGHSNSKKKRSVDRIFFLFSVEQAPRSIARNGQDELVVWAERDSCHGEGRGLRVAGRTDGSVRGRRSEWRRASQLWLYMPSQTAFETRRRRWRWTGEVKYIVRGVHRRKQRLKLYLVAVTKYLFTLAIGLTEASSASNGLREAEIETEGLGNVNEKIAGLSGSNDGA